MNNVKDLTGFEIYLHSEGYKMEDAPNYYLNTWDCVSRVWIKGDNVICVGLVDSPTRVGISRPLNIHNKSLSFLPSEENYSIKLKELENEIINELKREFMIKMVN